MSPIVFVSGSTDDYDMNWFYHRFTMHQPYLFASVRKGAGSGLWLSILVPVILAVSGYVQLAMEILMSSALSFICFCGSSEWRALAGSISPAVVAIYLTKTPLTIRPLCVLLFIGPVIHNLITLHPGTFTLGESFLLSHLILLTVHATPLGLIIFIMLFCIERFHIACNLCNLLVIFVTTTFALCSTVYFCHIFGYPIPVLMRLHCLLSPNTVVYILLSAIISLCCAIMITYFHRLTTTPTFHHSLSPTVHMLHSENGSSLSSNDDLKNPMNDSTRHEHLYSVVNQFPVSLSSPNGHFVQCEHKFNDDNDGGGVAADLQKQCSERPVCEAIAPVWTRKVFHFSIGIVYSVGISIAPDSLEVTSLLVLIALLLMEWIRRRGVSSLQNVFSNHLGVGWQDHIFGDETTETFTQYV